MPVFMSLNFCTTASFAAVNFSAIISRAVFAASPTTWSFSETASFMPLNFSATAVFTVLNLSSIVSLIPLAVSPTTWSFSPTASFMPLNFSAMASFTVPNTLTILSTIGFNAPSLYDFFTKSIALPNAEPNASLMPDSLSLTAFTIGDSLFFTVSTACPSFPPVILFMKSYPAV